MIILNYDIYIYIYEIYKQVVAYKIYTHLAPLLRLICDFQKTVGPLMVDQFEDLMVYFLEPKVHQVKDPAPYKKAILTALEWLSGKELRMDVVPDFKALQALSLPSSWGLMGYGALDFHSLKGLR